MARYGIKVGPLFVSKSTRSSGGGGALFVLAVLALAIEGWVYSAAGAFMAWALAAIFAVLAVLVIIGKLVERRD